MKGILVLLLTSAPLLGQIPEPEICAYPMSVVYNVPAHHYDMVANEMGIHILYDSSHCIIHSLIGNNGRMLMRSVVDSQLPDPLILSVCSVKRGSNEILYAVYRDGDTIVLVNSTNGGMNWYYPTNNMLYARNESPSNRISVVGDTARIHVTWDICDTNQIYYANYDIASTPTHWNPVKWVTDTTEQINNGDSVVVYHGTNPDITLSLMGGIHRVHVVYINERELRDTSDASLLFEQIVTRDMILETNEWQQNDILMACMENYMPIGTNIHKENIVTYPVVIAADSMLVVAHSARNKSIDKPGDQPHYNYYQYLDKKYAGYYYYTHGDEAQRISKNCSALYQMSHSLYYNPRNGWTNWVRRNEDSMIVYGDHVSDLHDTTVAHGDQALVSGNTTCAKAIVWIDDYPRLYRQPQDIQDNICLPTRITGKSRIKSKCNITVNDGINVIVDDTLILADSSSIIMTGSSKLILQKTGYIYAGDCAQIILNGGDVISDTLRDSCIVLYDSTGISGTGQLSRVGIKWNKGGIIPDSSELTFVNGAAFDFGSDASQSNCLELRGAVIFEGDTNAYRFGAQIDQLKVAEGGSLTLNHGVTLKSMPATIVWPGGELRSRGAIGDSVRWLLRDSANIDNYGVFDAAVTVFRSDAAPSDSGWGGILSAYEDSHLRIDSCTISDIHICNEHSGSAIHFYAANQTDNCIKRSNIRRTSTPQTGMIGYGIFLQPGAENEPNWSYATVACDSIGDGWGSAVTAVQSTVALRSCVLDDNLQALGIQQNAYAQLFDNSMQRNIGYGGYVADHSVLHLGGVENNLYGGNTIVANGIPLSINSSSIALGGISIAGQRYGGENIIHHLDTNMAALHLAGGSYAELAYNWWGVMPVPDTGGSGYCLLPQTKKDLLVTIEDSSTLNLDPAHCGDISSLNLSCDEELSKSGGWSAPGLNGIQSPADMTLSAAAGRFDEIYEFITGALSASDLHPATSYLAMALACNLEIRHARLNPDSFFRCKQRITSYLESRAASVRNPWLAAGCLRLAAAAYLAFGDATAAGSVILQLVAQHPSSSHAREIHPLAQLVAMAKRDDAAVAGAITEMEQQRYGVEQLRAARTMRQAYRRVLPRSAFPKRASGRMLPGGESAPVASELRLTSYPNPFTTSATIEFVLPENSHAILKVYTVNGAEAAVLADGYHAAGRHRAVFHAARALPSALYIAVLTTAKERRTRTLVVVR
jgi:hypothetical protein